MKLLLLLAFPAVVHAQSFFDLEAGVGAAHYATVGDGVWYQEGAEHRLGLTSPAGSIGVTGPLFTRGRYGVDWHADYVNLGRATSQCWCTPVDAYYSLSSKTITNRSVPLANFQGSGMAQGLALTVEPYFWFVGLRFSIEGGVFPYVASFNETVTNWSDQPGMAPRTLHVSTSHAINLGTMAGASVGAGRVSLSYRHFWLPSRQPYPAVWRDADMIEVKYRF